MNVLKRDSVFTVSQPDEKPLYFVTSAKSAPLRISGYAAFADLPCSLNLGAFDQAADRR